MDASLLGMRRDPPGAIIISSWCSCEGEEDKLAASSDLVRWGAMGFLVAGVVRLVLGFLIAGTPAVAGTGPLLAVFIVALLLTTVGLVGLHALQKERYGFMGRAGFYTLLVAIAARMLGAALLLSGSTILGRMASMGGWGPLVESVLYGAEWLVLVGGFGTEVVGFALYGAATVRGRVLPRWYGVVLIVFVPLARAFRGDLGSIWEGVVLLLLGYVLWLRRDASPEQPSRARYKFF